MAVEQHSAELSLELGIGGHCEGEKSSKLVDVNFALSRKTTVYFHPLVILSLAKQRSSLAVD